MDNLKKETAIQNEQQLNGNEEIVKELQELNKNLKSISELFLCICQNGMFVIHHN